MTGPRKTPSLPQVKVDFNKAAGNITPPKAPLPPAPKPNPPVAKAQAAPIPGRTAPAMKAPPPAADVQAKAAAAKAAAAKAAPKKPPKAVAPGGITTPVQPGVAFKQAATGAPPKGGVQATAQAQAQTKALQMKRDFARAAAQRKGGKGKTQEKQHTKSK
jgi:hypothetical protein